MGIEPAGERRTGFRTSGGRPVAVVAAKIRAPRVRWLPRERLDQLLPRLWQHRLALVVAPAGSGKTTLLAAWAGAAEVPAAWYRAESVDGSEAALLAHLEAAFAAVLPGLAGGWASVDAAATALDARPEPRVLLVVDDLHALTGTPAEAALERFIDYAPPMLAVAAGTRVQPAFNLSRRRVSGELLEVTGDDLRFRSWEVERLFRDFYGEALRPDELARLARRTEGWAAGLQLFHLATRDKAVDERQRLLAGLGPSSRLMREYLARNVVAELPDELREFLVGTCVLRRLTGSLCDRLMGRMGSGELLEDLERRNVFTVAIDDEGTYRYHEVLRSHLEGMLVGMIGETAARERARRAGELLAADGAIAEAVAAYSRAEDWAAVDVLLDGHGEDLAAAGGGAAAWIDTLPPALLVQDPWLILATARRHRAEGRWAQAVDAYARAESLFGAGETGSGCRRERLAIAAWLDPLPAPAQDWIGALRAAVARDPLSRRISSSDPGAGLAAGLAALLAGRAIEARRHLRQVAEEDAITPGLEAAARVAAGVAGLMGGDPRSVVETEGAVATAERLGLAWLARIGRAALSMAGSPAGAEYAREDAIRVREAAIREGDRWGEGLAALAEGWAALAEPDAAVAPLEAAAARFRALGAGSLEAWARALLGVALVRDGAPDAREVALTADALGRATGVPGSQAIARLALAELDPSGDADLAAALTALAGDGLALPSACAAATSGEAAGDRGREPADQPAVGAGAIEDGVGQTVEIRLFGAFAMAVDGRALDLGGLKPRPRAVLRFLALNANRPIHREVLQETFWPEADRDTGARNLHVALSALRRELAPQSSRGGQELIVREGDAYRLSLPAGARVDLVAFDEAVASARRARARGATAEAGACCRRALEAYGGDLLPEDGPAEWAASRRERARADLVETAHTLGEILVDEDPGGAAEVVGAGLAVDPYHDPLWRLLVVARERAGDPAAASTARAGYSRMLAELGVAADAR